MKKLLLLLCIICLPVYSVHAMDSDHTGIEELPDFLDDDYDDFDDTEGGSDPIYDPLEPLNRVFFEFNDKLYFWVLKPVKTGYSYVVPEELRQCVGNFFNNLAAPIRLINNILQGRFKDAGVVLSRFLINSTVGVYGFGDVAMEEFDIRPRHADFGQTLGVYGMGEGVYVHWPVFGPSNLRDSVGLVGDSLANPAFHIDMTTVEGTLYYSANKVNRMSVTPNLYEEMKKYSLDPYIAARQAFYDYRRNIINNASSD